MIQEKNYDLVGLWCQGCADSVEKALGALDGVKKAEASFTTHSISIEWDSDRVSQEKFQKTVERLGYRLVPLSASLNEDLAVDLASKLLKRVWLGLLGFGFLLIGHLFQLPHWMTVIGVLIFVIATSSKILQMAWTSLRAGAPSMDFLIGVGIIGSTALSIWNGYRDVEVHFHTSLMLPLFLNFGRWLEMRIRASSETELKKILGSSEETALQVLDQETIKEVSLKSLGRGDLIEVGMGQKIPLDGTLESDAGEFDRALLTGESYSEWSKSGDAVPAGWVNLGETVRIRITQIWGERRVDQLHQLLTKLLKTQPATQKLASRLASKLIFVMIGLSFLTLVFQSFYSGFEFAVLASLSVIVVTCPCALAIAAPLAIQFTFLKLARNRIYIRDPDAIEKGATLDHLFFDKTGTLSQSTLKVEKIEPYPSLQVDEILKWVAIAESSSSHPIAVALKGQYEGEIPSGKSKTVLGRGLSWSDSQTQVEVYSRQAAQEVGEEPLLFEESTHLEVWVLKDRNVLGRILLSEELREGVRSTLSSLSQTYQLGLLSGDSKSRVRSFAGQFSVSWLSVEGGCDPEDKSNILLRLRRDGAKVGFVGDGLNDGPVIAAADVGITFGEASDLAIASSQVVIQDSDLSRLAIYLSTSRFAKRVLRQNLVWALIYNALAIPFAMTGVIPPALAAGAMILSSVSVTANSARILRFTVKEM